MKKAAVLFALAIAVIGIPSCKKEEERKPPINETIDVQLKVNEAYTFTLPKNKRDDAYDITEQTTHYTISSVGKDAQGNRIYEYTPSLNYTGTDHVVVSNTEEDAEHHGDHPGNCHAKPGPCEHHEHHGNCDGGEEDHYIVTINFTIQNNSVTLK
jgi:hypothetical protein